MTWLLQPCDTHAFARFKRAMHLLAEKAATLAVDGRADTIACIRCVFAAILHVIQGHVWKRAFEECGLCGSQDALGRTVARRLQLSSDVYVGNTQPPADALMCVSPRRSVVRSTALWPRRLPPPASTGGSPSSQSITADHPTGAELACSSCVVGPHSLHQFPRRGRGSGRAPSQCAL